MNAKAARALVSVAHKKQAALEAEAREREKNTQALILKIAIRDTLPEFLASIHAKVQKEASDGLVATWWEAANDRLFPQGAVKKLVDLLCGEGFVVTFMRGDCWGDRLKLGISWEEHQ